MLLSLREARSCTGDMPSYSRHQAGSSSSHSYKGVTWRAPICGGGVAILASPSYQVPLFFFFSLTHFLCPISYWLRAFKKQERKGSLKGAWQPLATFKVAGVGRGPGGS